MGQLRVWWSLTLRKKVKTFTVYAWSRRGVPLYQSKGASRRGGRPRAWLGTAEALPSPQFRAVFPLTAWGFLGLRWLALKSEESKSCLPSTRVDGWCSLGGTLPRWLPGSPSLRPGTSSFPQTKSGFPPKLCLVSLLPVFCLLSCCEHLSLNISSPNSPSTRPAYGLNGVPLWFLLNTPSTATE